jgi:nucleoside-diphosphate-sugar epimerase
MGRIFWRPYCHVSDLANSIKIVLLSEPSITQNHAFNVGDTSQNYTKKMLMEEIKKVIPTLIVNYHPIVTDPRDYKVNCDKIKNQLGFKISRTVPDGIKEIAYLVQNKVINEPLNSKYGNV